MKNRFLKYYSLLIIALIMTFAACESYYTPDIDEQESHLVFSGLITDTLGPQYVDISQSSSYNDESSTTGLSGFVVVIEEKNGDIIALTETETGHYEADSTIIGKVNTQYRMKATSPEGKIYISSYVEILSSAPVNSISACHYKETTLSENTNSSGYTEETEEGTTIMASSNTNGFTPYYRYEYCLIIETTQLYPDGFSNFVIYIARPYNSYSRVYLNLSNANLYDDNDIINHPICNINNTVTYSTLVIDSLDIDENGERQFSNDDIDVDYFGMLVQIRQYSLSEESYSFWNAIDEQMNATGQFFDPVESQIVGNITCESDSTEDVYGYFGASSISVYNQHLYLKSNNVAITKPIIYFPTISELTWDYYQFDFWVYYNMN